MTRPKLKNFNLPDKIDPTGEIGYTRYRKAKRMYIFSKKLQKCSKLTNP